MPDNNVLSVTEMGTFLQCRHKWWLTSPSAKALQSKGFPAMPLILGTLVHAGLAAHAMGEDWIEAMQAATDDYTAKVHYDDDHKKIEGALEDATAWVLDYTDQYGPEPFAPLSVVATEQSFVLDILDPATGEMLGHLVGTFDGILKDENGGVYIVDHKTYSPQNRPTHEKYLLDLQFNAYAWVCREIFGRCDGILYDGIEKKHPAKFERFMLRPDAATLASIEAQIRQIFREAFSPDFYPLRILGYECSRCPVRDLCFTGMAGEDVDWLAAQKYETGARGSRSRSAVAGSNTRAIASLDEFLSNP